MIIAVINETSAAHRNPDILAALEGRAQDGRSHEGRSHQIINAGMKQAGESPELQYIHTGLMAAILLNLGRVDLVVGGCGTGQGFLNSVMQYPGVFCGLILSPLDAWLFAQINAGNCLSLALNQGYGWAADVNLRLVFDQFFSVERGKGYPPQRSEPQARSRIMLQTISATTHRSLAEIITALPEAVTRPALEYPGMRELIDVETIQEPALKKAFQDWYGEQG